jgi:hypothetical protein
MSNARPSGAGLLACAVVILTAACTNQPARGVELQIIAADGVAPRSLRFDWIDGASLLLRDVRVPDHVDLDPTRTPLAKIRVQVALGAQGRRRAVVRGLVDDSVVSEGTAEVDLIGTGWAVVQVPLAAGRRPDRDGDGVPDDVDDCPDDGRTFGPCDAADGSTADEGAPALDAALDAAPMAEAAAPADGASPIDLAAGPDAAAPDASTEAPVEDARSPCGAVLLVTGLVGSNAGDKALAARLAQLGCTVTTVEDSAFVSGDAAGKSLVVISETVIPSRVGMKLNPISAGIIDMDPELLDDMAFTGHTQATDWDLGAMESTVMIVTPAHPLAAKLTGTLPIFSSLASIGWGAPDSPAAIKIVSFPAAPGRYLVFAFEAGAPMSLGATAAGRRVAFLASRDAVPKLNADGWALFEAAVRWTASH